MQLYPDSEVTWRHDIHNRAGTCVGTKLVHSGFAQRFFTSLYFPLNGMEHPLEHHLKYLYLKFLELK